jgi:hypothetical protein
MRHVGLIGVGGDHYNLSMAIYLQIVKEPIFQTVLVVVVPPKDMEYEHKFRKWNFQRMCGYASKDLQTHILDLGIISFYQLQQEYHLIEQKQSKLSRNNRDRVNKAYQIITKDESNSPRRY